MVHDEQCSGEYHGSWILPAQMQGAGTPDAAKDVALCLQQCLVAGH